MNTSTLIQRLEQAATYNIIAETGYTTDENGRSKSINGNDRGRYAAYCNRILNQVLMELAVEETKDT